MQLSLIRQIVSHRHSLGGTPHSLPLIDTNSGHGLPLIWIQCQNVQKVRIKFASYSNQFENFSSLANPNHLYFKKCWMKSQL